MSNSPGLIPSQSQELFLNNNDLPKLIQEEDQVQVFSSQEIDTKIHFSKTSLILLILRIILILLFMILLTSETIYHELLESIEHKLELSSTPFISN